MRILGDNQCWLSILEGYNTPCKGATPCTPPGEARDSLPRTWQTFSRRGGPLTDSPLKLSMCLPLTWEDTEVPLTYPHGQGIAHPT